MFDPHFGAAPHGCPCMFCNVQRAMGLRNDSADDLPDWAWESSGGRPWYAPGAAAPCPVPELPPAVRHAPELHPKRRK